jgi:hypothetical protein
LEKPSEGTASRWNLIKQNKNKTQRRIHKYFFSHYFCFVLFRKNFIRGNAATNNTPNEGGKFHREIKRFNTNEARGNRRKKNKESKADNHRERRRKGLL